MSARLYSAEWWRAAREMRAQREHRGPRVLEILEAARAAGVEIRGDVIPRARECALPRLSGAIRYTLTGAELDRVRVAHTLAGALERAGLEARIGADRRATYVYVIREA